MSKTVAISFAIGAALSAGFDAVFNKAGKAMVDLGDKSSALSKVAGQVGEYQKLQQKIEANQAAMLAMGNRSGQLRQQLQATTAQTEALKTQFNAAQAEALKMEAAHQRSQSSYQDVNTRVKDLSSLMKAVPSEELRQKLLAADSAAQKLKGTVAQDSAQFKAANARAKELAKQLKNAEKQEKLMSREAQNLSHNSETLQKRLNSDKESLEKLRQSLTGAGVDMKNLSSEQARLMSQSDKLAAAQGRLQDAQAKFNAAKQSLSWGNIKGELAAAGALGLALKVPVTVAMNFEQAMSGVEAVSFAGKAGTEEQKADLEALKNKALELGRTTQFTAIQAANAQENLARAGFKSGEILKSMRDVLDMAAAEGMDLATAANALAGVMRGYGKKADESGHVADILAKTSAMTKTSIVNLSEAMSYAAPIMSDLGVPIEEAAALLGAMANANIDASRGGTALTGAYTQLLRNPASVEKALSKLKISIRTEDGKMRTLPSIMKALLEKMSGMGSADRERHLMNIFGKVAGPGMITVMKAVKSGDIDYFQEELKKEKELRKEKGFGTAHEMALAKMDNLAGDLTTLGSAWEGLNQSVGNEFIPAARAITEGLTGIINTVTGLGEKLPTAKTALAWGFGGFASWKIIKTATGLITKAGSLIPLALKLGSAKAEVAALEAGAAVATGSGVSAAAGGTAATGGASAVGSTGLLGKLFPGVAGLSLGPLISVALGSMVISDLLGKGEGERYRDRREDSHVMSSAELQRVMEQAEQRQEALKVVDALAPQINELTEQGKLNVKREDIVQHGAKLFEWLHGNEQAIHDLPEKFRPLLELLKPQQTLIINNEAAISAAMDAGRSYDLNKLAGEVGHNALGGIITHPMISWLAEDGPEAVVPLSDRSRGIPLLMEAGKRLGVNLNSGLTENGLNIASRMSSILPDMPERERLFKVPLSDKFEVVSMGETIVKAIPHATGGIFSTPHIGLVAESGPEAVIPLTDKSRGIPLWMAAGEEMGVNFRGGNTVNNNYTGGSSNFSSYVGGSPIINITVNGGGDDRGLAQKIAQAVQDVMSDMQSYEERVAFA